MRIPLLISAAPNEVKFGPSVILPQGSWKLTADGVIDTQLLLRCGFQDFEVGSRFDLEAHTKVFVVIVKAGSEKKITLFAQRLIHNGNEFAGAS